MATCLTCVRFYIKLWYYTIGHTILGHTKMAHPPHSPCFPEVSYQMQHHLHPPCHWFEMLMELFLASPSHQLNSASSVQGLPEESSSSLPLIMTSFPNSEENIYFRSALLLLDEWPTWAFLAFEGKIIYRTPVKKLWFTLPFWKMPEPVGQMELGFFSMVYYLQAKEGWWVE